MRICPEIHKFKVEIISSVYMWRNGKWKISNKSIEIIKIQYNYTTCNL